ncbi:hypothetical protein COV49_04495 [Candidatus Falkowbacteria bacterium CG11_big_fil_rev_8_21_14_0_20_39_10]|uniref:Uncharacterized protein n=1 Tax=Candidatus Falkowbacteria bacterium CG11_big_fil_rev_8_21_14_0_20_39_10 TaxID=1974570 RepID=A0A2M6K7Y6_9BACT|nr:MAG: hypothetical protein COV49_04495 [Candidatus Falkowbacteria bacterium CG11_big_fil_rev_8_21_14_0_20_39_10]
MKKFFRKKFLILGFIIILIIAVYGCFKFGANPETAMAATSDNVAGYAWSENAGWLSFNCADTGSCETSDYGVHINQADNNFNGYAWSDSLGWISFQESASPPDSYGFSIFCPNACNAYNNCTACYDDQTQRIYGWAKILSLGDDGWVKMSNFVAGAFGFPKPFPIKFNQEEIVYGIEFDPITGDFSGWAWNGSDNDNGLGWISFNCADDGAGGCEGHDYRVHSFSYTSPVLSDLSAPNWSLGQACAMYARQSFLRWQVTDPDYGAYQKYYAVGWNTIDDPDVPAENYIKAQSSASQHSLNFENLDYDTTYYWWVNVWDDKGLESGTSTGPSFVTYKHEFPRVDFDWSPREPEWNELEGKTEPVFFTQLAAYFTSASPDVDLIDCGDSDCIYDWDFPVGTIILDGSETGTSTLVQFATEGNEPEERKVALTVTDSDGFQCSKTIYVNMYFTLPTWKEVKPE